VTTVCPDLNQQRGLLPRKANDSYDSSG